MIKLIASKYPVKLDAAILGGTILCPILIYSSERSYPIPELNITVTLPTTLDSPFQSERKSIFYIIPIFETFIGYPKLEVVYVNSIRKRMDSFYPNAIYASTVEINPLCIQNEIIHVTAKKVAMFTDTTPSQPSTLISSPV